MERTPGSLPADAAFLGVVFEGGKIVFESDFAVFDVYSCPALINPRKSRGELCVGSRFEFFHEKALRSQSKRRQPDRFFASDEPDDVDALLLDSLVVCRFSGNDVGYCRGDRTVDGERGGEEKAEKRCSENPFAGKQRDEPVGCGAMLSEQDVDPMEISDNDKYQQAVGRAVDYG